MEESNLEALINLIIEGNEDMISTTEDEYMLVLLQRQRDDLDHLKELIKEMKK